MAPEADNRAFLERFESPRRSYVTNLFVYAVRRGMRTPHQVMASVEQELRDVFARSGNWPDTLERTELVYTLLHQYYAEALAFAIWALAWETLTPAQKQQQRAAKGEEFRQAWMEQQPATDRQQSYLKALGYAGEVTSKAHASELIERLKRGVRAEAQP